MRGRYRNAGGTRQLWKQSKNMERQNSGTRYTLYIGSKNFSSWSLRAWLAMKMAGIEFDEVLIPLRQPETKPEIRRHSPSGKVPLLVVQNGDEKEFVWDSFAICETLAERCPSAGLWPDDARARAQARSISAEMHSGFPEVRAALPMDITARIKTGPLSGPVQEQVARILAIWESALTGYGGRDGFLFGRFSIADAFYAPVATRFITHGIELPPLQQAYVERILSLPVMQEWAAAARQ
jgi:glutathione S-transferase